MFEKLFGSGPKTDQKKSSEFDLDCVVTDASLPMRSGDISRSVYILGNEGSKFLPDLKMLQFLPMISSLRKTDQSVHIDAHYIHAFQILPRSSFNSIMNSWNAVMDVFKAADESEVDDIILVGPCYSSVLEGRRVFLEQVFEKIGTDTNRYEHIRKCLEFYAPTYMRNKFDHWSRI